MAKTKKTRRYWSLTNDPLPEHENQRGGVSSEVHAADGQLDGGTNVASGGAGGTDGEPEDIAEPDDIGPGGDESQGKYQEYSVPSSILPLCVLHQSTQHRKKNPDEELPSNPIDDDNFPDFLNAPVNLRSAVQQTKLNCSGEANLFQAYVENREPADSPITGSITATVSSFNVVTNDHTVGNQLVLKSVNRKKYDLQLSPTTLTVEHIQDALRWLEAEKYERHDVENVQSGMMEYFEALQRVNINGDESQLEKFIRNHTWDGPAIWFPNIFDELHRIEEAKKKDATPVHP